MRYIPHLVCAILLSLPATAQQVHFSMRYKPNHTYAQKMDQIMSMEMNMAGDTAAERKIEESGNPLKNTSTVHIEASTSTGALHGDTLFPVKMLFTKIDASTGKASLPDNLTIYGNASTNGMVRYDSIDGKGLTYDLKNQLFPALKKMAEQINLPEKTLRKGESFVVEMPLSIPAGGFNLDFTIKSTYTLKSISGNTADFDIVQVFSMNSESVAVPMTAKGSGKGSLTYDIRENYFTDYEATSTIDMSMNIDRHTMNMKMESSSVQKIAISNN